MKYLVRYVIVFLCICFAKEEVFAQNYNLSSSLEGTSGLIYYNDTLISMNDHNNSYMYFLDTIGNLVDSVDTHIDYKDLEEISQDSLYIYLGDFGNNSNGNRQDLKIYKILKTSLHGTLAIDSICFSYSNQTDYSNQGMNNTDFDCEAMIVKDSMIYLFTKQWLSQNTSLYRLENTSGNHVAQLISTYNINGLVTGATFLKEINKIVLIGYSKTIIPFYVSLLGFGNDDDFLNHTVDKQNMGMYMFHQMEAITHSDMTTFYITNEKLTHNGVTVTQQLHKIYLPMYSSLNSEYEDKDNVVICPIPAKNHIDIKSKNMKSITIYNTMGEKVYERKFSLQDMFEVNVSNFSQGEYVVEINKQNGNKIRKKFIL